MSSGRFASLLLLIVMVGLTPTWPASGQGRCRGRTLVDVAGIALA